MSFKLFTRKKSSRNNPTVAILKTGNMYFNGKFCEEFFKNVKYFNLYFDNENKKIGIKPVENPEIYSYSVREDSDRSGFAISAKSFYDECKIQYPETKGYNAQWNDEEKLIEVKIQ